MKHLLLVSTPILLSSCLTTTFHDTLVRARLDGPLPSTPVYVPSSDTSRFQVQGSLSLDATSSPRIKVQLIEPNKEDDVGNTGFGKQVDWTRDDVSASGEVSLLLANQVRLFGGFQGNLDARASWFGGGFTFGKLDALELSIAGGTTTIGRELTGYRVIKKVDDCQGDDFDCTPSTETTHGADTTIRERDDVAFTRLKATLARRGGGPWGEISYTTYNSVAHTIEGGWTYDVESFLFGAGWAFPVPVGHLVVGVRTETLGKDLNPSAVFQWTGAMSLD